MLKNQVIIECINCKKLFSVQFYRSETAKFCSYSCYWLDKKGKAPLHATAKAIIANTGKQCTEQTKVKISLANTGRPKRRKSNSKHLSEQRHIAMGRIEYTSWRDSVFKRDNYTCQICGIYGARVHADHILPWCEYPKLRYETSNGRTLCVPCHYYVTFKRKIPLNSRWGLSSVKPMVDCSQEL